MQVFNLIYTKVSSPEESPWQKAGSHPLGAHTLFYPIGIMTKEDVRELEKKIQFPDTELGDFDHKKIIFYQKIRGEYHLVILHIRSLPDARDVYGRSGIFLCHGFIFPPEVWRNAPTPLTLFNLLKDSLFMNREDVLSSPKVDRKTGNILPIEISQESLKSLSKTLPHLTGEFEPKMVMLLNRIARIKGQRTTILLKGEPDNLSAIMDKIVAYIPNDLKVNIGWDPAFEGGDFEKSPLNIVGFKNKRPIGGNPLNIDVSTLTIQENSNTSQFFTPYTPYENWLNQCHSEVISQENIERAYSLSLILEAETTAGGEILPKIPCFVSANKSLIENLFFKRCEKILGTTITQHVSEVLDVGLKFDLLIENLPITKLSEHVEDVIWNRLIPKSIKVPLPDSLIDVGSYRLKLIARLWKGEVLVKKDLEPLDRKQKIEFVRYLLLTGWAEKDWLLDILKEDEEMFKHLLSTDETKGVIEGILLGIISRKKDFKEIERSILNQVLNQKKEFSLFREEINLMGVLEEFLKKGSWDDVGEIKGFFTWAKKTSPPVGEFPYIKAFLYPKQGIPESVLKDGTIKEKLLRCLIEYHRYGDEKDWLLYVLKEDEEMFKHLLSTDETKGVIERILLERISIKKDFKGIEKSILSQVKEQKKEFSLFRDQINLMEVLEEFLKKGSWGDVGEIKDIFTWAKKTSPPVGEFPYIKAFLYPKQGIPEDVLKDRTIKKKLQQCLEYHRYSDDELENFGFKRKKIPKEKGLIEKVQGLLRFKV